MMERQEERSEVTPPSRPSTPTEGFDPEEPRALEEPEALIQAVATLAVDEDIREELSVVRPETQPISLQPITDTVADA